MQTISKGYSTTNRYQLTDSAANGANVGTHLLSIGYYTSPPGGTDGAIIGRRRVLCELITAGAVYAPDGAPLCGPGWLFLHRAGHRTIHRAPPGDCYECLCLHFTDGILERLDWPRSFRWSPPSVAVAFSDEMLQAYHRQAMDRSVLADYALGQLVFRLAQFRLQQTPTGYPDAVARVVTHLESHYAGDVSLNELADLAGLSVSHLHNRFRAHVGITPHQYQIRQRIRPACHLLVTTLDSVAAIGAAVGYANTESFCRAFRQHQEVTAAAYRRRHGRLSEAR